MKKSFGIDRERMVRSKKIGRKEEQAERSGKNGKRPIMATLRVYEGGGKAGETIKRKPKKDSHMAYA